MAHHNIKGCIEEAISHFFLSNEGVDPLLDAQSEQDFMVHCFPSFFHHLIYNLVKHAIDHGHAKKIHITAATRTFWRRQGVACATILSFLLAIV